MPNLYPGAGRPLYQATYDGTNPPQLTWPNTAVLTSNQYSDGEPIHDALSVTLSVVYNVAPTAATEIHLASDPTFANYFVVATLPISADLYAVWETLEHLSGFLRVKNTSTKQINSVVVQKVARY